MQKALHPAKKDVSRKRVGNMYSAPKEKFGNSFGNRAVIFPEMKENAELVDVFGNNKARCRKLDYHRMFLRRHLHNPHFYRPLYIFA